MHSLFKVFLRGTVSIFCFHEVSDDPSPFCRLHDLNVTPTLFGKHLDFLSDYFHFISPDELLKGGYETPAAMITFDDGMPGYFRRALPILLERKIPSTLFANIAPMEGQLFWSALITYLTEFDKDFVAFLKERRKREQGPLFLWCDKSLVEEYLKRIDSQDLEARVRKFYGEFAKLKDLETYQDNPYVFFGSHFYNHYNAARMTQEELSEQYVKNDERLRLLPQGRSILAYPFGQPDLCFSAVTTMKLFSLGARMVFSSSGRVNPNRPARFFDRICADSGIRRCEDLLARVQKGRLKSFIKSPPAAWGEAAADHR